MTRFGMGEQEMDHIAKLIKECIIDNKPVKEEVNRFRSQYRKVHYSYDENNQENAQPVELSKLKK